MIVAAGEVVNDIGDIEIHKSIAANGTTPISAAAIDATGARTIAIVTPSASNVGVFLSGDIVGSIAEVYSTGGTIVVYAGGTVVSPPPFLDGSTSVSVTSGARFKRTATAWAYLS